MVSLISLNDKIEVKYNNYIYTSWLAMSNKNSLENFPQKNILRFIKLPFWKQHCKNFVMTKKTTENIFR